MKWGPIISILLVLITLLSLLLFMQILKIPAGSFISNTQAEEALVTYVTQGWTEDPLNSSQVLFYVDLYNFGYIEAKNVEVNCVLYPGDIDGNQLSETATLSVIQNTGNIASTSVKGDVIVHAIKNNQVDDNSLVSCKIVSCEDCEILDERLK